jgi:hypothetical protein
MKYLVPFIVFFYCAAVSAFGDSPSKPYTDGATSGEYILKDQALLLIRMTPHTVPFITIETPETRRLYLGAMTLRGKPIGKPLENVVAQGDIVVLAYISTLGDVTYYNFVECKLYGRKCVVHDTGPIGFHHVSIRELQSWIADNYGKSI